MEQNIGAAAVQLTSDDLREFESVAFKITVQGDRNLENLEQMANRQAVPVEGLSAPKGAPLESS